MTQTNPLIVAATDGPFAQARKGTVVAVNLSNVVVLVGGTEFVANYLSSYDPTVGDIVSIIRQDATWMVSGRIVGQGDNEVLNSSFESDEPGTFPVGWEFANVSGVSSAAVTVYEGAPAGERVLTVTSAAAGTSVSYAYSPPISVVPGEEWSLSAYVGGDYELGVLPTADAGLVALWFANATNLYPTTSAADTVAATLTDVLQVPPFTGISGNVVVPAGAVVMRVAARTSVIPGQSLLWDLFTARKVDVGPTTGPVAFTVRTSASAGTVAEAIAINTPMITFRSGRAYRVAIKGVVSSTIAGDVVRLRLRRTGLAGTAYLDTLQGLSPINGANNSTFFYAETILVNNGADVVDDLVLTYSRNNGTGSVTVGGSAGQPSYIEVTDAGPSGPYAGASAL